MLPRRLALAVTALLAVSAAPAQAFDAAVGEIHVTQSIQTVSAPGQAPNQVPLIANRTTAVRAAIPVVDGSGPITGRVHVFVGAQRVTPPAGTPALTDPYLPPPAPTFAQDNGALLFELPAPTGIEPPAGADIADDVRVRVEIQGAGDTNPANDAGEVTGLRVERRVAPEILWAPIHYTPSSLGLPNLSRVGDQGDAGIRAGLPVDDSCRACLYRRALGTVQFSEALDNNSTIDNTVAVGPFGYDQENWRLIDELIARRAMLVFPGGAGPNESTYLFGWVRDGVLTGHAGMASLGERVGYAHDRLAGSEHGFQQSAMHEFTHMLGLDHNAQQRSLGPNVGWDAGEFGGRLVGNPPENGYTTKVKPPSTPDIVNPLGGLWPDATTYTAAREGLPLGRSRTCPRAPTNTLSILGEVVQIPYQEAPELEGWSEHADPREWAATVDDVQLSAGYARDVLLCQPKIAASRASLLAHVRLRAGRRGRGSAAGATNVRTVRVPIDARMTVDDHAREHGSGVQATRLYLGPFHLAVPVGSAQVQEIRITDRDGRRTFTRLRRSQSSPKVSVQRPRRGGRLGRRTTIAWKGRDADTPQRRLSYRVAFSPDAGRTWLPVATHVGGNRGRFTFDARELPPTNGRGMLRVDVSDGLNSASTTVGKLDNPVGAFRPPAAPRRDR